MALLKDLIVTGASKFIGDAYMNIIKSGTWNGSVITEPYLPDASTSAQGVVLLSDVTNGTSTTKAATENAVKKAYDLANGKWAYDENTIKNVKVNDSDKLDGYHETSFFKNGRTLPSGYLDGSVYTTLNNGNYSVLYSGYSGALLHFNTGGSASGLDILINHFQQSGYSIKYRKTIDSNRFATNSEKNPFWTTFLDSENYTSYINSTNFPVLSKASDIQKGVDAYNTLQLANADVQGTIDRWDEVVAFLAGISEGLNLASILLNYVTTNTALLISGAKTFTQAINGDLLGNATTADRFKNARTIKIGNTTKTYDGSANVEFTLTELGVAGNYKTKLTAVPTIGNSTWTKTFVNSISLDENGVITATTAAVRDASASTDGIVSTGAQSFAGVKTFTANTIIGTTSTGANLNVHGITTLETTSGNILEVWKRSDTDGSIITFCNGTTKTELGSIGFASNSATLVTKGKPYVKINSTYYQLAYSTAKTAVGGTNAPVYIDANGQIQACTTYANASVNYATTAGSTTELASTIGANPSTIPTNKTTIHFYSNMNGTTADSNGNRYAGTNAGFPVSSNANGILYIGVHPHSTDGATYAGQLGISSNGRLYYRFTNGEAPSTAANGGSWNKLAWSSDIPTKLSWNYDDTYLKLTGGQLTGDLILYTETNGDSPSLIFLRQELNQTSYFDWRIYDTGGVLKFQISKGNGWEDYVSFTGAESEIVANKFTGNLNGNASTATTAGALSSTIANDKLPTRLQQYITSEYVTTGNGFGRMTSASPFTPLHTSNADCMLIQTGYSDIWAALIALDYRSNGMFIRNKNNGTWNTWNEVVTVLNDLTITGNKHFSTAEVDSLTAGNLVVLGIASGTLSNSLSITMGSTTTTYNNSENKSITITPAAIGAATVAQANVSTPNEAISLIDKVTKSLVVNSWTTVAYCNSNKTSAGGNAYANGMYSIYIEDRSSSSGTPNCYAGVFALNSSATRLDEIALHAAMATSSDINTPTRLFICVKGLEIQASCVALSDGTPGTHIMTIKINRII